MKPSTANSGGRVLLCAALLFVAVDRPVQGDCTLTSVGTVPLTDMGATLYQDVHPGGLYPGGTSQIPEEHLTSGIAVAQEIQPLSSDGVPDKNGQIGMVSIGFSNCTQIFAKGYDGNTSTTFKTRADQPDSGKSPKLTLIDCAYVGHDLHAWVAEGDAQGTWGRAVQLVGDAGLDPKQVQVGWVYVTHRIRDMAPEDRSFPRHAELQRDDLITLSQLFRQYFPNAKMLFVSSRERAYVTDIMQSGNPELWAYESGFGVRWLIQEQLNGNPELNFDPANGPVKAPFLSWGPYFWIDGTVRRSDGMTWECKDLQCDHYHPNLRGIKKDADQLLGLMKTSPLCRPWFVRRGVTGQAPEVSVTASPTAGEAPLTVDFSAAVSDPDGEVVETAWNFDDGTFRMLLTPKKRYSTPGTYKVRLAATDNSGNVVLKEQTIEVLAPGSAGSTQ